MIRCLFLSLCLSLPVQADQPAPNPFIEVAAFQGQKTNAGAAVPIEGQRFEIFSLKGYTGEVTWDCSSDAVRIFQLVPGSKANGFRMGTDQASEYDVPPLPIVQVQVFANGSGRANLTAWGVDAKGKAKKLVSILIEANRGPQPPPPVPPGPVPPGPVPPGPTPPSPLPSDKLRVLTVYESADTLTAQQNGVMRSTIAYGAINQAGGEWKVLDKDIDVSAEPPTFWRAGLARPRTSLPWVIISSPKGFWEGPLPKTVAEYLALIKTYGG